MLRISLLALTAAAGLAAAQTTPAQPASPSHPAAKQPDAPAPKAAPKPGEPTLIKYDKTGAIQRPELPPEEAALELVGLDLEEVVATQKIVDARAAMIDKALSTNLQLLQKALGLGRGDNKTEQLQAIKDFWKVLGPEHDKVLYREQLTNAMATEKGQLYGQLQKDYWQAINQQAMETQRFKGQPATESQIKGFESLIATGQEMRRSYERKINDNASKLPDLLAKLSPTPEQQPKLKAITDDLAKAGPKPTIEQKREAFQNVMKTLVDEQRMKLLREMYPEQK